MADLMTMITDYTMLVNKYGNFTVPTYKIKVSGSDAVATLDLTVYELSVVLSLNSTGIAIIKIADAFDKKSHSFNSKIKNKFKLGMVVEIELGYLSSTVPVFKGFVAGIGTEFIDSPLFIVKLMDARRLMMNSGSKRIMYSDKNYSDVFKKVMSGYSKLCSVSCDPTSDQLLSPISQSTNDYNFVQRELIGKGKADREFFILYDKAYFRIPQKIKPPIMTVNYGRELLEFNMMADYLDVNVQVVGYNPQEQKEVVSKAKAKSPESQTSVVTTPVMLYVDPDADSDKKAKTRAAAIATQEVNKACTAEGKTVGLPEIVPGRFIKVAELDPLTNKKYYISEVRHTITNEEFTTCFEAKGWA